MMVCSSAVFALPAAANLPRHMPGRTSIMALVALGFVNTGLLRGCTSRSCARQARRSPP